MSKEVWKDIAGYEGLYQVSNWGRVKSLKRFVRLRKENDLRGYYKDEKIISQNEHQGGYLKVDLFKNNIRESKKVHRLVAQAFIPNTNNYPCINHKDEDRKNNNADNLEWCTYKYNNNYGKRKDKFLQTIKERIKKI